MLNKGQIKEKETVYKRLTEINFQNLIIRCDNKKQVTIKIAGENKLIHMIDIEYKNKKNLLLVILKQKLLEFNKDEQYIKVQINEEVERKIKELESHLIDLIYENSCLIFNGKNFSKTKIKAGLISNLKTDNYTKYIYLKIKKNTEFYEIDKNCNKNIITNYLINYGEDLYCKCIIYIENLQFVDNRFTYNLVLDKCEIERKYNYSFVVKNGEIKKGEVESEESEKLDDEYWDSASI